MLVCLYHRDDAAASRQQTKDGWQNMHSNGWPCPRSIPSAGHLSRYVTSHPGQLSLAIPLWVGAMSTSQRAVMPCGWGVMACMVCVWDGGQVSEWAVSLSKQLQGPSQQENPQTSYIITSGYDCRNKCIFSFCRDNVSDKADVMSSGRLLYGFWPASSFSASTLLVGSFDL